MTHLTLLKKITASVLASAGFVVMPLTALAAPTVSLQITAAANSANGISYHITVTNTGDQVANDVFIRDTLDARESFASSVLSPAISSTQNGRMMLTWNTPSINPGATYTIDLNTTLTGPIAAGTAITDNFEVEGLNFTTQTATTTVLAGPIAAVTPTPTPTATPIPTPIPTPTLPATGVEPLILMVIALSGIAAGTLISRRLSLKNS